MNSFVSRAFSLLLGWVRSFAAGVWNLFSGADGQNLLTWIGSHWKVLTVVLCAVGVTADLLVHLARWKPLTVWKSFFSRLGDRRDAADEAWTPPVPGGEAEEEELLPEDAPETDWVPEAAYTLPEEEEPADEEVLPYAETAETADPSWDDLYAPAETEEAEPETPAGTGRRLGGMIGALLRADDEEKVYGLTSVPPARDKSEAFSDPYIPPQWKAPSETGMAVRRRRSAGRRET